MDLPLSPFHFLLHSSTNVWVSERLFRSIVWVCERLLRLTTLNLRGSFARATLLSYMWQLVYESLCLRYMWGWGWGQRQSVNASAILRAKVINNRGVSKFSWHLSIFLRNTMQCWRNLLDFFGSKCSLLGLRSFHKTSPFCGSKCRPIGLLISQEISLGFCGSKCSPVGLLNIHKTSISFPRYECNHVGLPKFQDAFHNSETSVASSPSYDLPTPRFTEHLAIWARLWYNVMWSQSNWKNWALNGEKDIHTKLWANVWWQSKN